MKYERIYQWGIADYLAGKERIDCPFDSHSLAVHRAWWLAGWHDTDMERPS